MNRSRLDELINGEIDGVNGRAETDELAALLRSDPEARRRHDELREAVGLLERLEMVEPPAELRDRIMSAVDEAGTVPGPERPPRAFAPGDALRGLVGWLRRPAVVPAFAAGVLATLILVAVGRQLESGPPAPAQRDLLGVVLPEQTPALAGFESASPGVRGAWRAVQEGERTLLRLDLETERPVDVSVQAGRGSVCTGHLSVRPPAGGVSVEGGRIVLRGVSRGRHDLLFRQDTPGPAVFRTVVTAGDAVIDESSFAVGRIRED